MKKISQLEFFYQDIDELRKIVIENQTLFQSGSVFLLSGAMGVGKTEFVKTVVEVLHRKKNASSPTFSLHHHYEGHPNIEHWDLYRLKSEDDLESSGFWDQFSDQGSLIFIEWPDKIKMDLLPADWKIISFEFKVLDAGKRQLRCFW